MRYAFLGINYYNNLEFLYDINKIIIENKNYHEDKINKVIYKNENDIHMLIYDGNRIEFNNKQIREIIIGLIDILEKIYPLGTMVELKKEYLEKIISKEKIEKARIIIVNRYISNNGSNTFFQYAGVVYPIGMFDQGKVLQFTSGLIDNVVYKGYSDKQEDAYVYLMKKELIIEKKMHSLGFLEEELNKYEKESDKEKL